VIVFDLHHTSNSFSCHKDQISGPIFSLYLHVQLTACGIDMVWSLWEADRRWNNGMRAYCCCMTSESRRSLIDIPFVAIPLYL